MRRVRGVLIKVGGGVGGEGGGGGPINWWVGMSGLAEWLKGKSKGRKKQKETN